MRTPNVVVRVVAVRGDELEALIEQAVERALDKQRLAQKVDAAVRKAAPQLRTTEKGGSRGIRRPDPR